MKSGEASTNMFSNIASSNMSVRKGRKEEGKGNTNYILVENNMMSNKLSSENEPMYSTAEMSFIDEE